MSEPIFVYKPLGQTPLQALEAYRNEHPHLSGVSMTYAGRLDPMAEGLLMLLAGDDVHDKEAYLALDKEYTVQILIGIHTDTYDILGLVDGYVPEMGNQWGKEWWEEKMKKYIGPWEQEYPPYASKTVHGVPLFMYARLGTLDTIAIPTKKVTIHACEVIALGQETKEALSHRIETMTTMITGDFRQEDIMSRWEEVLSLIPYTTFQTVDVRVVCSSGTYIRSLIHRISKDTGIPMCVGALKRTHIGAYTLSDIK